MNVSETMQTQNNVNVPSPYEFWVRRTALRTLFHTYIHMTAKGILTLIPPTFLSLFYTQRIISTDYPHTFRSIEFH